MDRMNPVNTHVSVIDPINPAIERVKLVLFAPFDLGRWCIIGFCAWLAQIGRAKSSGGGHGGGSGPSPGAEFQQAKEYVFANLSWLLPLAILAVMLIMMITLVVMWLSSRGRFMFLDCVARNVAHVRDPWHRFRDHAASLFGFRVAAGLIMLAITLALSAAGVAMGVAGHASGFPAASIIGLVSVGLILIVVVVLFLILGLFTTDFVVPIMYLHGVTCTQAWRMLLDVLSWNQGRFILYILFQLFLKIAIAALVFGVGCMTCCVGFCLLALPYIGTVVMLPVLVFERSYSAYYLSQYGPQLNVFPPPQVVSPAPQALS